MAETRAVFDAINEILASMRPNKLEGRPQLWEKRRAETGWWNSMNEIRSKLKWDLIHFISFEAGSLPQSHLIDAYGDLNEEKFEDFREEKLGGLLLYDVSKSKM